MNSSKNKLKFSACSKWTLKEEMQENKSTKKCERERERERERENHFCVGKLCRKDNGNLY